MEQFQSWSVVMSLKLLLLSFHFAVLTMLAFPSGLSPMVNSWLKQLSTTSSLSCLQKHEKGVYPFQLSLVIREGKLAQKPPSRLPHGYFDSIRLLDHAPSVGRLVKHVSAIFSLYTGRWVLWLLICWPHKGWRMENLFWSIFLYCVKI